MLRRALEGTVGRCEPGTGKIRCRNAAPSTERSRECRRDWAALSWIRWHYCPPKPEELLKQWHGVTTRHSSVFREIGRSSDETYIFNIISLYVRSPCYSWTNTLQRSHFERLGPTYSPPTRHFLQPKDSSWQCKCTFGYLCKTEMLASPSVSGSSCWPIRPSLPTRWAEG